MSEKTNAKRRFNLIDAIIIVLVILCIVGIYFRSQITQWIGIDRQLSEYKMTFKVSEIKYTSERYLASGKRIYLDTPAMELGTIDGNCTVSPAETYIEQTDGSLIVAQYPKDTYIDVMGSIKCSGTQREDGFYLAGSYSIAPGMKINVHTEMLDFVITVIDITE